MAPRGKAIHAHVTAAEFEMHPAAAGPSELVRGEVRVMTPASGAHGLISGAIFAVVHAFVEQHALGICFSDNTGFRLPGIPDTVRSPDMAFVRASQVPAAGVGRGFFPAAPDLVVEVLSPSETASDLEEKLRDYLAAGTSLAWIIDPEKRVVCVRAGHAPDRWLGTGDILDGGDVLPGFAVPVARLFARLAP
jgi:Uma2 family endonuclease